MLFRKQCSTVYTLPGLRELLDVSRCLETQELASDVCLVISTEVKGLAVREHLVTEAYIFQVIENDKELPLKQLCVCLCK